MLRLFSYWRSSAAYRVRIALGLKQLDFELAPVHLVRDGGQHHKDNYRALNPQGLVPLLQHDDVTVSQSLAMIEYLDEVFPDRPLLPASAADRARVRSLAQLVACDIHPLNNLRVTNYLKGPLGVSDEAGKTWYRHWIIEGFGAFEKWLESDPSRGQFCHADQPGLADAFLIPQVYNARRFEIDLDAYPRIVAVDRACLALDAFRQATPEAQADAEPV